MSYNKNFIIEKTEEFVKDYMKNYDSSHDFFHIMRVKKMAIKIANKKKLNDDDIFEIILGALFHDVADHKYIINDKQEDVINNFLKTYLPINIINNIIYIACNVSLSKQFNNIDIIDNENIKLICVRDADRLDSLGAIGIARYFTYGIIHKNSNITDVINNIENRTSILLKSIKTKYAKKIAKKKYKIIKMYIKDYKKTVN